MHHPTEGIAKLTRGRKNWYKGREGIQVNDCPVENVNL